MMNLENKTILVTGAAGFIGTHLAERLAGIPGVRLLLLSRQDRESACPHVRWLRADLRELTQDYWAKNGIERIDVVFHLGAAIPKKSSEANDSTSAIGDNIVGTTTLLEGLPDGVAAFVFSSTLDVYAPTREDAVLTEASPPGPATLYGASKLFCEQLVSCWAQSRGVPCAILRYGHIYGPGEERYQKLIPVVIRQLLASRSPSIHGDGSALRDYLYVGDAVEATVRVACLGRSAGPINVVRGQSVPIREVVEGLARIMGSACPIEFLRDKPNGASLRFDNRRMLDELGGWRMMPLEDGLKLEIASFKENS